ncbi:L,D-transpeptidase [Alicyclobacillus sp. ALC3]|uniref:L,D-transpeptidase n=1 Tax=Alicyclobacillus sp. ALC3 TaxID=2796143 RepID=UPI0023796CF7|nr:L,D-transpeptidase [Alicyclobacillus sp. ALC3]WDL95490.1 L,D-transpeptidase [Alicyclobacillus sp. ALC3]
MKLKGLSITALSVSVVCGLVIYLGVHVRHVQLKQNAAKSVAITSSKWEAFKGIHLTFSEPLEAVTWTMDGHAKTIHLKKPSASVWLNSVLPQGQKSSVEVQSVETTYNQTVTESWKLSDVLAKPLQVITDPGTWQLNVSRNGPYMVQFSAPILDRNGATKAVVFKPSIPGKWVWKNSETADFYPMDPVPPTAQETLVVGDGIKGPVSDAGQFMASPVTRPFITASDEKIVVQEQLPETLSLYKNGKVIFQSLCNTAVPGAYTPTGTFYIRSKYSFVDMRGVNPNGVAYNDPHVPWVMGLIGNVAIHGYPRATYGWPQSNGCVELPISAAKRLYSMVKVGTPVEIMS